MCQGDQTSQLIWTSSSNAQRSAFDLEDIQHKRGCEPYSSSKYASDLLSLALNTHYNQQVSRLVFHAVCFCLVKSLTSMCCCCCLPGSALLCDMSRFCHDKPDIWCSAIFSIILLDPAFACLLACECMT